MENNVSETGVPSFSETTWTELECMNPGAREEHTCTLFQDYIITIGGTEGRNRLDDVIVFDIRKSTWQRVKPTGDAFLPRGGHTACLYKDNQIIVFGGHSTIYAEFQYSTMKEVGVLTIKNTEPFELEWKVKKTRGEVERIWHTAHVYEDSMYVFGGGDKSYHSTNEIYHLDLESFIWTKCQFSGSLPTAYRSHCSALYKGKVYLFGGFNSRARQLLDDVFVFNLPTLTMTKITKTKLWPGVVSGCSMCEQDGELYVFGGKIHDNSFTNDLVAFNIQYEAWRQVRPKGTAPSPRGYHRCLSYNNSIIFWGGGIDTLQYSNLHRLFLEESLGRKDEVVKEGKIMMRPRNSNYTAQIKTLLLNKSYSDICFKVGEERLDAHKNILSARCKYFKNMFASGMIEAQTAEINIPDVKPETFRALLEFMYCDELEMTEDLTFDLLELADKYGYSELRDLCVEFLSKCLTLKNLVEIANISETLELPSLQSVVSDFVVQNYDYLEKEKRLFDLPKSILVDLSQKMRRR